MDSDIAHLSWRRDKDVLWLAEMRAALNMATPKSIRNPDMYVEGLLGYCDALRGFPADIGARSTRPIARFFASVDEKKTRLFTSNSDDAQAWRLGLQRVCENLVNDSCSMELFTSLFIDHAWNPVLLLERSKRYNQPHGVEPSEAYPAYILRALRQAIVEHSYKPMDHPALHSVWNESFNLNPAYMTQQTKALANAFPTSINAALAGLYDEYLDETTPAMDTAIAKMDIACLKPESYPLWVGALTKWRDEGVNAWSIVAQSYPRFAQAMEVHAALGDTESPAAIEGLCTAWRNYAVDTQMPESQVQLPELS